MKLYSPINKKNAISIENPEYLIRNPNYLMRDEAQTYCSKKDVHPSQYRRVKPTKTIITE